MLKWICIISLFLPALVFATESFVAGKDYEVLKERVALESTIKKVKVTEFFSYGCPSCYHLEPQLQSWLTKQGQNIEFTRIPVVFNKAWRLYAKAYYAAHILGKENLLSSALFKAVQENSASVATNENMVNFFIAAGIDKSIAKSAFESSPAIDLQIVEGMEAMARYRINAVPALIINNQYKIDLPMAKNQEELFKVLDFLIGKAKNDSLAKS